MNHAACPACQVRFSAAVAQRQTCPFCFGQLVFDRSAAQVLGYQRYFELQPDPRPIDWDERRA